MTVLVELSIVAFLVFAICLIYADFNDKRPMKNRYHDHIMSLKVGRVKKYANEEEIELEFIETEEVRAMAALEEEVARDANVPK